MLLPPTHDVQVFPVSCCTTCPRARFNFCAGITCPDSGPQAHDLHLPLNCPLWRGAQLHVAGDGVLLYVLPSDDALLYKINNPHLPLPHVER